MKNLNYTANNMRFMYVMLGILFGTCFPLIAIIFEMKNLNLIFNMENIYHIHSNNPLLFIIDTAPFFLGSFAWIAGNIRRKLEITNMALEEQSKIDELTKLYNRRYGKEKIEKYIELAKLENNKFGVILIDLDRFKMINDNLGHDMGDKLLKCIGNEFVMIMDGKENVIRLGGDEFIILVNNVSNIEEIKIVAQKIMSVFEKTFNIDNISINVKASMGMSVFPDHGQDEKTLLRKADIAMYTCKKYHENTYEIFKDEMLETINENFHIGNEMYKALEKEEFFIEYQPIINVTKNKIIGAEALLRWNSPKLGLIGPDKFIPIAESTNEIITIGKWVLKEACIQTKYWHDQGYRIIINVNVSVNQFKQVNFVEIVKDILKETRLQPEYLKLEVTENIYMENMSAMKKIFDELKKLKVKIAIDDFGTGYSSFAQLKALFIDTLKIDKSFIDAISVNVNNTLIVSAIITLAKSLNLNIVAEGVETIDQLNFLKNQGCNQIQGYLYSKPLKADKFEELLNKGI